MIYKYELEFTAIDLVIFKDLPKGAKILSVGIQDDKCFIWAEVNAEEGFVQTHRFFCVPTGLEMVHGDRFLGTVFYESGFVAHIFTNFEGYRNGL